eukprot:CAMPEP_0206011344 /NCGR_PEP_ID=MMETSP1464-20131121/13090_1 /ASSEMBLY_ACC=CAM_ASM_001124 /TAXON_ID=119497 /ORGANISM="Exanthemachrysis gayraliae, Strain RCC1523" /LENGTH=158 /DNA_ID=CAMNT_0053385001 /DNA_START=375 /DNA_END=853 /DNA_ORIENTATION=+
MMPLAHSQGCHRQEVLHEWIPLHVTLAAAIDPTPRTPQAEDRLAAIALQHAPLSAAAGLHARCRRARGRSPSRAAPPAQLGPAGELARALRSQLARGMELVDEREDGAHPVAALVHTQRQARSLKGIALLAVERVPRHAHDDSLEARRPEALRGLRAR